MHNHEAESGWQGIESPEQVAARAGRVAGELRGRYYAVLSHLHKSITESKIQGYIGDDGVRELKDELDRDWHAVEVLVTNNAGHHPEDLIAPLVRYEAKLLGQAERMKNLGISYSPTDRPSVRW